MKSCKAKWLVLLVIATLALTGCIGGGSSIEKVSEEKQVLDALDKFQQSLKGDPLLSMEFVSNPVLLELDDEYMEDLQGELLFLQGEFLQLLEGNLINEDFFNEAEIPEYLADLFIQLVGVYEDSGKDLENEEVLEMSWYIAETGIIWYELQSLAFELEMDDEATFMIWLELSSLHENGFMFPNALMGVAANELQAIEWHSGVTKGDRGKWYAFGTDQYSGDYRLTFEKKGSKWLVTAIKPPKPEM